MVQVNAIGDACPIPVIKTLHALQDLNGAGTVQTLVDNEIAVQNLTRLAESKGCSITTEKRSDKEFCVTITTENSIGKAEADEQISCTVPAAQKKTVVVISADHMGEGDEELKPYPDQRLYFCAHPAGAPAEHDSVLQRRRTPDLRRLGIARGSEKTGIARCGDSDLRYLSQPLWPDRQARSW